jgi:glutamate carboxypeptidase
MEPLALLRQIEIDTEWIKSKLRQLVLQESPSDDPAAVNLAMELVEQLSRDLDGRAKRHKQNKFGDIFELRFGPRRSSRKPLLLLGH